VAQLLNQAQYFKTFPDMRSCALDRVRELLTEMSKRADRQGIDLHIILIPTKFDVEPETLRPEFWQAAEILGLRKEEMGSAAVMREELARGLARNKVRVWDPHLFCAGANLLCSGARLSSE